MTRWPGAGDASTPRAGRSSRALVTLAALALAAAAVSGALARRADLARLASEADGLGLDAGRGGALDRALRRAGEAGERRLALARALVDAGASDRDAGSGRAGDPAARLRAAASLAREALARLPASWEAAEIVGLARALERVALRDPSLLEDLASWRRPLEAACARFPGSPRPEHALAAAWLEVWPGLASAERGAARDALTRAFADPGFFARAAQRWIELSASLPEAAEVLPDRTESWRRLGAAAVERGELARAAEFHERGRRALATELDLGLAGAASSARAVDQLLVAAPRDGDLAPWIERALATRPAAPADPEAAAAAERWLAWARPLCLASGCPFSPAATDRLASLGAAVLSPPEAAFAALAAGDEPRAERIARDAGALASAPWAPYSLLAATRRLAAGDRAGARDALAFVHPTARPLATFRELSSVADGAAAGATGAEVWESTAWEWERGQPRLALRPGRAADALVVSFARPVARPALVVAEWNGRPAAPVELPAGADSVRLRLAVAPAPSLLRLAPLAGELPPVGAVRLD